LLLLAQNPRRGDRHKSQPHESHPLSWREELCRILVEWVTVGDREIVAINWTPRARPFYETAWCPQGALETRPLSEYDPLAWYAA